MAKDPYAQIVALLNGALDDHKLFTVFFFKQDKTVRRMECGNPPVSWVTKHSVRAQVRRDQNPNLFNVFDTEQHEWRSINMNTLFEVRIGSSIYRVEGLKPKLTQEG